MLVRGSTIMYVLQSRVRLVDILLSFRMMDQSPWCSWLRGLSPWARRFGEYTAEFLLLKSEVLLYEDRTNNKNGIP